jgi:hypothetical protein
LQRRIALLHRSTQIHRRAAWDECLSTTLTISMCPRCCCQPQAPIRDVRCLVLAFRAMTTSSPCAAEMTALQEVNRVRSSSTSGKVPYGARCCTLVQASLLRTASGDSLRRMGRQLLRGDSRQASLEFRFPFSGREQAHGDLRPHLLFRLHSPELYGLLRCSPTRRSPLS